MPAPDLNERGYMCCDNSVDEYKMCSSNMSTRNSCLNLNEETNLNNLESRSIHLKSFTNSTDHLIDPNGAENFTVPLSNTSTNNLTSTNGTTNNTDRNNSTKYVYAEANNHGDLPDDSTTGTIDNNNNNNNNTKNNNVKPTFTENRKQHLSFMNHIMPEKMSQTNLYIKGLPENFDDEHLWRLPDDQSKIKSVKAAVDEDAKCRGYGFIDFITEEAAKEAIQSIRNKHPSFTIKFAKENEKDKTNLYVTNLPRSWTTKDSDKLKLVFERFGHIQSAFVMMERLTNKTTGVGFVRFVHERDALNTLETLRASPLTLPDCDAPIEVKFADKHNPDTRRRRNPGNTIIAPSPYNNFINYPLCANNGVSLNTQGALATLITHGLVNNSLSNNLVTMPPVHKNEYNARIPTNYLPGLIQAKPQSLPNTVPFGSSDMNGARPNQCDSNLAALAVAASSLFGSPTNGFISDCLRTNPVCLTGPLNPNLSGNLMSTNPITLLGAPGENKLLDPSLYGCSLYNTDYFRSQQQQQQLLSAAVAAMTNSAVPGCLYPSAPDLNSFATYHNLINPQNSSNIPIPDTVGCLDTNDVGNLSAIYTNNQNGMIASTNLTSSLAQITDPNSVRQDSGLYQWYIPSHLLKNGTTECRVTIPSTAISFNQTNPILGFEKSNKHVQMFL